MSETSERQRSRWLVRCTRSVALPIQTLLAHLRLPLARSYLGVQKALASFRPRTVEDRNILLLHADIALQGVVAGGAAAYLSVFTVRLGATPVLVGLLSSLPSLVIALLSLPAGRYVERQTHLIPVVVRSRVWFRISYLLIALVPWVLPGAAPVAIVAIWAVASAASAFANVSFTAAMAEIVPTSRRAGVISLRYAIHAVVTAATLPVTGRILDSMPFPVGYQVVFLISFVAAMLSAWVYSKIQLPEQRITPHLPTRSRSVERLRIAIGSLATESRFTGYLISSAVFRIGLNLPAALFSIFWVNELGLSDGSIALVSMVSNVSSVLGYFYWGRLAKSRGHGPVLVASGLGLAAYPLLTAASWSLAPLLVAAAAGGWFSAGINLALFNVLLAVAPQERRSSFVAVDAVVANAIAFAGPLLGSLLTELLSIRVALVVSAVFRLLGAMLFVIKRVRD